MSDHSKAARAATQPGEPALAAALARIQVLEAEHTELERQMTRLSDLVANCLDYTNGPAKPAPIRRTTRPPVRTARPGLSVVQNAS